METDPIASEGIDYRSSSRTVISSNEPIRRSLRAKSQARQKDEDDPASEYTVRPSNKSPNARWM
jgi:hypothetical protein